MAEFMRGIDYIMADEGADEDRLQAMQYYGVFKPIIILDGGITMRPEEDFKKCLRLGMIYNDLDPDRELKGKEFTDEMKAKAIKARSAGLEEAMSGQFSKALTDIDLACSLAPDDSAAAAAKAAAAAPADGFKTGEEKKADKPAEAPAKAEKSEPAPKVPDAPVSQVAADASIPEGTEMVSMTMREALRDAMAEEMRRDGDVFVMGEEVAEYQGAY